MNKEIIKKHLEKWLELDSMDELNFKWVSAKLYVVKNAKSFEERKELDFLVNDYYQLADKEISARLKDVQC